MNEAFDWEAAYQRSQMIARSPLYTHPAYYAGLPDTPELRNLREGADFYFNAGRGFDLPRPAVPSNCPSGYTPRWYHNGAVITAEELQRDMEKHAELLRDWRASVPASEENPEEE